MLKRTQTLRGALWKKKCLTRLLLDEKICFIRLPPDTLQNFWQVITRRPNSWPPALVGLLRKHPVIKSGIDNLPVVYWIFFFK
jgi:hypothetical protein